MTSTFRPDQTRYELEEKLGEGLNCVVWRATRYDFSGENRQMVALKLPKDQTAVPVLRREFEVLQRIQSVFCTRVIAWESFGGRPALALEWIDGINLFEFTQASRSPVEEEIVSEIVRQIYLALLELRALGLAHGDLQPTNIMIGREGRIRLIDFASGRTSEGHLQATPAFVAPAIWAGEDFSFESDLFALKVIRDHLPTGFRHLPDRASVSRDLKIAKENSRAREAIALRVTDSLSHRPHVSTQVISGATMTSKSPVNHPNTKLKLVRVALALGLSLAATLPVRAEAPADQSEGAAALTIASQSWLQLWINGAPAGFAPLNIKHLQAGDHRLTWKGAHGGGEIRLRLNKGDSVRVIESRDHVGRLEVR